MSAPETAIDVPFADIRRWMFDQALPFWAEQGVDHENGGFLEQLDFEGRDTGVDFKRTRVTSRQIYVFAHAAVLGWTPGKALADQGVAFLKKAWLGPDGGWARLLNRQGEVLDTTPDLYDIAFALFALGWHVRATGDTASAALALQTLDFLDAHMRPSQGRGFLHEKPAKGRRLQNPHMHLMEAALACLEATGDARYAVLAQELESLFRDRLFDPETQTLAEYFDDDWNRASGDEGRIVEPGHQLEWAWILANLERLTGAKTGDLVRGLTDFAERHGVDPETGVTFNQVRDDGVVLDRGSRTWPNTERLKGHVARFEQLGEDPRTALASSSRVLLDRYLGYGRPALWMDHFGPNGEHRVNFAPASTLYHVFLAFAEVLRIEPRLAAL
ncbi:AGE family epimerase/isomerase [Caulobacter sp. DWR2-3-1b2]|uniref:AGE family epimerase/isomerase n=1 Tax=unclassified Caulobacter TaxID=2648921 RepID=UPI0019CEBF5A|nr:AGE family epimerase/isomerase [Caulobacter sp.]